jgi:GNAT superfamily N-acetyltransferase
MEIKKEKKENAVRLSARENGEELGAMYLYLIRNDSHKEPYGFLEDVLVKEEHRKKGIGTLLVKEAIAEAKRNTCYKIIGTSRMEREQVHQWYEKLGFKKCGYEFRIDLS